MPWPVGCGVAGKAVLLDAGAGQRRVRRDAAVDHRDPRPPGRSGRGPARAEPATGSKRSARRLVDMVEVDLQRRRGAAQRGQRLADVHPLRDRQRDHADAKLGLALVADQPGNRRARPEPSEGIGIGRDQLALRTGWP